MLLPVKPCKDEETTVHTRTNTQLLAHGQTQTGYQRIIHGDWTQIGFSLFQDPFSGAFIKETIIYDTR